MIIADNMLANGAARQFKISGNNKKKATEKLTSGYRINRASDDAAGLSISEKMRGQIRGLTQGVRNVEDGISLCQVADGALSEVTSMLHRITELSVQSANDTNTDEDRNAIQNEIGELLEEIDRISDETEFNTQKIFQGSQIPYDDPCYDGMPIVFLGYKPETVTETVTGPVTGSFDFSVSGKSTDSRASWYVITSNTSLSTGLNMGSAIIPWDQVKDSNGTSINIENDIKKGTYSFEYKGMKVTFTLNRDVTPDQLVDGLIGMNWSSKLNTDYVMHYDFLASSPRDYSNTIKDYTITAAEDGLYVNGIRSDWPFSLDSDPQPGFITFVASDIYFSFQAGETNTASFRDIIADIGTLHPTDSIFSTKSSVVSYIRIPNDTQLTASDEGLTLYDYNSRKSAMISWNDLFNNSTTTDDQTILHFSSDEPNANFDIGVYHGTSREVMINAINDGHYYPRYTNDYTLLTPASGIRTYSALNKEIKHAYVVEKSVIADKIEIVPEYSYIDTRDVESVIQVPVYGKEPQYSDTHLMIQYGANSGQALQLEIDKMNTNILGINDINVSTRDGASNAITLSQKAIEKVTENRSKIGAYQNRMEHIVDNENNMIENTQAAESRIRDSDMAKEMVDLAKQQILEQVGTSMITQANQNTQGILKLLQ